MAVPSLDLELPPFRPELTNVLGQADCTGASFAIYSMTNSVSEARINEIAAIPQGEWEEFDMNTKCIKPAVPTANFAGKTLKDIVDAHISMDKELEPREGGALAAGWWPHVFIVVVNENIEDHGLLLVYGFEPLSGSDDEQDEGAIGPREPTMGKFFFKPEDMCNILSGIALSGDDLDYLHETYDMDRESASEAEDDEVEEEEDDDVD
ncbi:hypothetical protein F4813DRAFT_353023 [Daldinia decipiens]|uniref:uncharacterized protein n=1 Tax=Daldinia decipiens TaxID=326647 RepID=UPI0020C22B43|nr:uncharacterized protein F4813DRAFT_353023 [Daldinia decipiens]KAI1659451.1 hypothetical protein F4813DRAFT_353023 [Daldinia decipiens]